MACLFDPGYVTGDTSSPVLPILWCVCSSIVRTCGPLGEPGPWHSRHMTFAGLIRMRRFRAVDIMATGTFYAAVYMTL